jgi:hypothetical protein
MLVHCNERKYYSSPCYPPRSCHHPRLPDLVIIPFTPTPPNPNHRLLHLPNFNVVCHRLTICWCFRPLNPPRRYPRSRRYRELEGETCGTQFGQGACTRLFGGPRDVCTTPSARPHLFWSSHHSQCTRTTLILLALSFMHS